MQFLMGFLVPYLGAVAPELVLPDIDISAPITKMFTWFTGMVTTNAPTIVGVGLGIFAVTWGLRKAMSLAKSAVR